MSWCLSSGSALNCSPALSQRRVPRTFLAPTSALLRTSVASPCGVFTRGSLLVSINVVVVVILSLDPNSAFDPIPDKILGGAVEDSRYEPVRRLKFEIEQRRLRGAQTVLRLSRYEHHIARPDFAGTFRSFDGTAAFHDEVEMLAILMQVIRGRGSLLVAHDARQHVVDLGEF